MIGQGQKQTSRRTRINERDGLNGKGGLRGWEEPATFVFTG
ncbi:hypothetical protein R2A130_3264 [Ahrensia sp. R2A130]|nr:hypothetical protein R2A130_3264 [Ahrensia sp. R2A130]